MNSPSEFSALLDECRKNFGSAPRHFGIWNYLSYLRSYDHLGFLRLLIKDDLKQFFKHQKSLLKNGQVVWGHTVQANSMLFRPGSLNLPGEVVYCTDPSREVDPTDLSHIAQQIFLLKGVQAEDAEQQAIGDYLADELIRVFGLSVPETLSPILPCAISTIMFNRRHLPNRRLSRSFYPLLIHPKQPQIAMVLPSRYWTHELQQDW